MCSVLSVINSLNSLNAFKHSDPLLDQSDSLRLVVDVILWRTGERSIRGHWDRNTPADSSQFTCSDCWLRRSAVEQHFRPLLLPWCCIAVSVALLPPCGSIHPLGSCLLFLLVQLLSRVLSCSRSLISDRCVCSPADCCSSTCLLSFTHFQQDIRTLLCVHAGPWLHYPSVVAIVH